MKTILLAIGLAVPLLAYGAGGDIVGAARLADIDAAFKLSQQQVAELRMSQDARMAYMKWLSQMPEAEQRKVYEKVFKLTILPQLNP